MNIQLRNVLESDLPVLFEHQADPVANQMAAFPARDRDSFLAHWKKILAYESNLIRIILFEEQVAGTIMSFDMDSKREIGYWLGRQYWGKGIATQALTQFLVLERTRPLYGYVVKHNFGSRRVLEKCGFSFYGEDGNDVVLILK